VGSAPASPPSVGPFLQQSREMSSAAGERRGDGKYVNDFKTVLGRKFWELLEYYFLLASILLKRTQFLCFGGST
jgi:hypothetical protein